MEKRAELSSKLFGLNKKQTDDYLEQLAKKHTENIQRIKAKVKEQNRERERLSRELQSLRSERNRKNFSKEFMKFALKRANEWADMLNRAADKEIDDIAMASEQNLQLQQEKLSNIQQEINNTKSYINFIVKDIVSLIQRTDKVQESKVKSGNDFSDAIPFTSKLPTLVEKVKENGSGQEGLHKKKESFNQWEKINKVLEEPKQDTSEDFWGSTPEYKHSSNETPIPSSSSDARDGLGVYTALNKKSEDPTHEDVKKSVEISLETEKSKTQNNSVTAKVNGAVPDKSTAITAEINQIRHRYVVGKIAGEDLYDREGKLIIAKNEVITAAAVDKASQEGKLAELIVSMVLPGLGD